MERWLRFLVMTGIVIFSFVLESTILNYAKVLGISPSLSLALVVSYGILRGDLSGAVLGFFLGLLQDIFFGRYLGFFALNYTLIGYFCGKPFRDFFRENYLFPLILTLLSSLVCGFWFYVFNFLLRARVDIWYYFYKVILPEALYTTLLSALVYKILYSVNKGIESYERKKRRMFEGE